MQYQLPLSDSMASRSRKLIPNKPTKSDLETESSSENGK